jgi:hypothetical protein
MFNLVPNPTFTAEAPITLPGAAEPAMLLVEWRHRGRFELKAWLDSLSGTADVEALMQAMVGWENVVDGTGKPVDFSLAALTDLLDAYPPAGGELCQAYVKALTESRLGN